MVVPPDIGHFRGLGGCQVGEWVHQSIYDISRTPWVNYCRPVFVNMLAFVLPLCLCFGVGSFISFVLQVLEFCVEEGNVSLYVWVFIDLGMLV